MLPVKDTLSGRFSLPCFCPPGVELWAAEEEARGVPISGERGGKEAGDSGDVPEDCDERSMRSSDGGGGRESRSRSPVMLMSDEVISLGGGGKNSCSSAAAERGGDDVTTGDG